jgi:hypothetical protein
VSHERAGIRGEDGVRSARILRIRETNRRKKLENNKSYYNFNNEMADNTKMKRGRRTCKKLLRKSRER